MNSDVLTNVLLQVPALAVVVYLVIHFFNYLKSSRDDERAFIARLAKDQSDIIDRNTQALVENHQMANETREALAEMRVVLEQRITRMPVASKEIDDNDPIA